MAFFWSASENRCSFAVSDYLGLAVCLLSAGLWGLVIGALILRVPAHGRLIGLAGAVVMAFPLIIQPHSVVLRAIGCVVCADVFLKLADYGRQSAHSPQHRSFGEFCYLLIPFPLFVAVIEEKRRLSQPDLSLVNFLRIVAGALGVAASLVAVFQLNELYALQRSFWLDHLVKVPLFLLAVEAGARTILGIERLLGFRTTPLVRNVFLSLTVAEFWLRWNNRVHRWLHANVFRPVARRHRRVLGLWAVFFASAVLHEFAVGIATGSWDGYQFTFFMLQPPMVLLSDRVMRATREPGPAVTATMYLLTVVWMTCTSVLFLRGVERVFPFVYVSQPWLP